MDDTREDRFIWRDGEVTIVNPDGTVVVQAEGHRLVEAETPPPDEVDT